jgi:hypothetical protein
MVQCFMAQRTTRIVFTGHESRPIEIQTGIPQGSPLPPVLFLFFISELLETLQTVEYDTYAFGFVDNTNLVTWGVNAKENCKRLESAHEKCVTRAARHGAKFAPEKYQLMHLTRKRKHDIEDLASTVQIEGEHAEVVDTAIRVLGVWVDPKLS